MAKARLYFDGDNTYIEKQARIYKMVDEIGDKIDNIPGVVNNLSSTSETDALSAAMWKELQDQINAMSWNFHFLSSWDCTTGLPWSDPATDPYTYQSWDYYIVSNTGSTNYKPHWSSYTHWVASTAIETQAVQMNDWYVYDGSTWILQPSGWAQIVVDTSLSTTSTNPVENRVITQALNNKQNTIANLSAIESWAAAWATALQPWANITQLTNNAWYQTAGDVATAVSWKQDVLTEGDGIDITNNVISCTVEYTWWTDIEVTSNNVINFTNASWYMLKSSNKLIYATTDTAFNTRDKICTTADWNYSPTQWDVLALVFNNGCWVGSPRLNIDNSWLHSIVISSTGWANASTLWLGMSKIAWTFVYDWTNRITRPIKDTLYSAWTWLSLSNWTFTNTQPWPTIWTTAPSSPSEWAMRYDTTNHVLKVYNGTEWVEVWSWWGWGSTTWWNIWGILSNQTDLQDALDDKLEATDLVAWNGINITPVWSELPTWYTQVAYLQSSWNAVINTAITWIWKKIVSTTNSDVSQTAVQIFTWYNSDYLWTFIWVYSNRWCAQNASWGRIEWVDANTVQDLTITFTQTSWWLNASSVTIWQSTWTFTRTAARPDGNLWIFWITENGVVIGSYIWKIYSYKVYDAATDALITELIPCLNDISVPWFYDTANATFYPKSAWTWTISAWPAVQAEWIEISVDDTVWTDDNVVAWTGISIDTWTSARLPSWYTEVEWIQSDGACYVDTGIVSEGTDRTETKFQVLWVPSSSGAVRSFFWSMEGTTLIRFSAWIYIPVGSSSTPSFFWWWNNTTQLSAADTNVHILQMVGGGSVMLDGVSTSYSHSGRDHPTITSYLFARHWDWDNVQTTYDWDWTKIYYHKQYRWTMQILDLIPCVRDSDDEPGFYDLVNERFLANWWSWTLTAWPAVTFNPTKVISSTVLWFNNLTYDSFTSWTWTANATVTFPTTAKMAFLNWRAKSTASGTPPFACWQVLLVRGLTLVSSFVWWGNWTDYIYWWVWLDSASTYVDYTQASKTAWAAWIDYTIYFYK